MAYFEVVKFNPPGALMTLFARAAPYALKAAAASGIILAVELVLRLLL
jgi:hypothetical protein